MSITENRLGMIELRPSVGILITFLFAVCLAPAAENQGGALEEVAFCDLIKTPSAFAGKRIRVRAVYRYAFEVQRLEAPACCSGETAKIWIEVDPFLKGKSLRLFHSLPKGQGVVLATFTGTFESGSTFGTFADKSELVVDGIERMERPSRSSQNQGRLCAQEKTLSDH
jgi:hypothetical protein